MTKQQPNTDSEATTGRVVNLKAMSQADAAWLLGRPTSFLKHHANLFDRDEQGRYDARQVVAALVEKDGGKMKPAKLSDADTEFLTQAAEVGAYDIDPRPATIARLDRLFDQHGAAALATFGQIMLDEMRYFADRNSGVRNSQPRFPTGTQTELEAEALKLVTSWRQQEQEREARESGRRVQLCPHCKRYRWVDKMLRPPIPAGYISDEITCRRCEAKGLRD